MQNFSTISRVSFVKSYFFSTFAALKNEYTIDPINLCAIFRE